MNDQKQRGGGPKSDAGKQTSSQNSTTHGMCQERFFLLPGESREQYDALRESLRTQYDINQPVVSELVEMLAESDWIQRRCTQNICKLQLQLAEAEVANDDDRIGKIERRLNNAYRYKTAAENSFQRAFRALEKFRTTRKHEEVVETKINIHRTVLAYDITYKRTKLGMPLLETTDNSKPPEFVP